MSRMIKSARTTLLAIWNLPNRLEQLLRLLYRCIRREHEGLSRVVTKEFLDSFNLLDIDEMEFYKDDQYVWLITADMTCIALGIRKDFHYGHVLKSIRRHESRLTVRVGRFHRNVPVPDITVGDSIHPCESTAETRVAAG